MPKNHTIVCFGDSITKGYTPFLENELKKTRYSNYKVINEGIDGNTSRDALERLNDVVAHNPEIVILSFGMNDSARDSNISFEEYTGNMSKLIQELRKNEIETMILTVSPKELTR